MTTDKSIRKREYIVECARRVFATKGFRDVTMKDIVDACEISRGGLYLYFSDTESVFRAVLEAERSKADNSIVADLSSNSSASDLFALFLKEQKKELLTRKDSLNCAIYEYYFAKKVPKKENHLLHEFNAGVKILSLLITSCVENGTFLCSDPEGAARNIMYVVEGLRIRSVTEGLTERQVDEEFVYIMQGLVAED